MENNKYIEVFLEKAKLDKINFDLINLLENMIITQSKKFYNFSCQEIFICLMKLNNQEDEIHIDRTLIEMINTFILFALSEITIFSNFDQFTITCSCIIISLRKSGDQVFLNSFVKLLSKISVEEKEVDSCVSLILDILKFEESPKVEESGKKVQKRLKGLNKENIRMASHNKMCQFTKKK